MPNTLEHWKHTPSTAGVVFSLDLPYRPPTNSIGALLWRGRMCVESTLGLSIMEPWEKVATLMFFYSLLLLTFTSVWKFTPLQLSLLQERLTYYFYGHEEKGAAVVTRVVSRLTGHNITGEL
ncbi:hypothetical protein BDY19DRAFT_897509 [Irpex rosettiformis]|uniref:Uncharacterized protein n=1 Tax=Irpex rosettiformis TaxID=378272 RepID=A0ACB8TSZ4_9APHY|nr:hypothetical protein BDY19DRAFT_897509 [Irpex rosettiformis]